MPSQTEILPLVPSVAKSSTALSQIRKLNNQSDIAGCLCNWDFSSVVVRMYKNINIVFIVPR